MSAPVGISLESWWSDMEGACETVVRLLGTTCGPLAKWERELYAVASYVVRRRKFLREMRNEQAIALEGEVTP